MTPMDFPIMSDSDWLERYRQAAFIAYGALMARNADRQADQVLALLDKYLFPAAAPHPRDSKE